MIRILLDEALAVADTDEAWPPPAEWFYRHPDGRSKYVPGIVAHQYVDGDGDGEVWDNAVHGPSAPHRHVWWEYDGRTGCACGEEMDTRG